MKSEFKTTMLVQWLFVLILLVGFGGCTNTKSQGPSMEHSSNQAEMQLSVKDSNNKLRRFRLEDPVSVSRQVKFQPALSASNTYHLPPISAETFKIDGQFTGDVDLGGSCNVVTLKYIPHTITHLETAAHVLSPRAKPPTVMDLEEKSVTGLLLLLDMTHIEAREGALISWQILEEKLSKVQLPITALAIKTRASELPEDYDFSGKNFLALSPEAARGIQNYHFLKYPMIRIDCLVLDLPSIDPEKDEGKLLAHRAFFGLPEKGFSSQITEKRALVELAYFTNLYEGYYYLSITPPKIQTNAVATGITLSRLTEY